MASLLAQTVAGLLHRLGAAPPVAGHPALDRADVLDDLVLRSDPS